MYISVWMYVCVFIYFFVLFIPQELEKRWMNLRNKSARRMWGLGRKSVVNHLYWSASTSTSGDEVVARWTSVADHVQNVHSHENALFPHCLHEPLVGERARVWLKPSKYYVLC